MKPSINENISLIGVAMDLGAGISGCSLGPAAMRCAGVVERLEKIGYHVNDKGDIVASRSAVSTMADINLKNLDEVVRVNEEICKSVDIEMAAGRFPLVLGGDHSIAIGTIAGVLQHKKNLGIIWIDAHGDMNTPETSPTGNIHGMSMAVNLGIGHERLTGIGGVEKKINPKNVVFIGCRDLDAGEREILKELGTTVFTMHEIDKWGMNKVMESAIEIITDGTDGFHLSFDVDSLDPSYIKGTGTRVPGGLTFRESNFGLEMLAQTGKMVSAEFVEVNPLIDNLNTTAETAVTLIGSLMGERLF